MALARTIQLRRMELTDVPHAMRFKEAAAWNQTPRDWEAFLRLRPGGCFLATLDGEPAGTVTTIAHDGGIGWIGMLLVKPELRGLGIGARLLDAAIESLSASRVVKLDATPEGRKIYLQRGFVDEAALERRVRDRVSVEAEASEARVAPLEATDLTEIAALDASIFGASRRRLLEEWMQAAPQYAFVLRSGDGINGYCLGRSGTRREHVGPIVANGFRAAKALLLAALAVVGDKPAMLDVFSGNIEWLRLLDSLGFSVERGFMRMRLGPESAPGDIERQWAIAGPEVG